MRPIVAYTLLLGLLTQPAPKLLIIGDSYSVGCCTSSSALTYVSRVATQTHLPIDNRAISGSTIAMELREQVLPYHGDASIAILLNGANDIYAETPPASYRTSLRAALGALRTRGMRVYVGLPLGFTVYERGHGSAALLAAYQQITREEAATAGAVAVAIAYDPQTMEHPDHPRHPGDLGHQAIAESFLGALGYRVLLPLLQTGAAYPAP